MSEILTVSKLSKDEILQYFFDKGYKCGDTDISDRVKNDMATESWQALEYFELL